MPQHNQVLLSPGITEKGEKSLSAHKKLHSEALINEIVYNAPLARHAYFREQNITLP